MLLTTFYVRIMTHLSGKPPGIVAAVGESALAPHTASPILLAP